jgi:hypothetical protein
MPRGDSVTNSPGALDGAHAEVLEVDFGLAEFEPQLVADRGGGGAGATGPAPDLVRRRDLDALTSCFVQNPVKDPDKENSAQHPGHRPRTTTDSAPAFPARPDGGGVVVEMQDHEFEAALARLDEYAAGGGLSA